MVGIAISYRREDTAWITGRIFDRLKSHYENHEGGVSDTPVIFMDYDSTPVGVDFRNHIMGVLNRCEILLAIIGPRWFGDDGSGRNRIMDETDWVRIEIEYALRKNIPVVPVLIDRTPMPVATALPEGLRELVFRQAAIVDTQIDFNAHVERLIRQIDRHAGMGAASQGARSPHIDTVLGKGSTTDARSGPLSRHPVLRTGLWALALAAICVFATALFFYFSAQRTPAVEPIYAVYNSPELGVTIVFPHNVLSLDNTQRSEGMLTLRDANGQPMVRILRTALPDHKDIREGRQREIEELTRSMYTLTYVAPEQERNWSNWYVLSGVRHGAKFYFRRWYSGDSVVSIEFVYPPTLQPLFDKLIPTMTREFGMGRVSPP